MFFHGRVTMQTPRDCGIFRWLDREATPYERTFICDLRDAVWELRRDNANAKEVKEKMQMAVAELRQAKEEVQKKKEEVKQKLEESKAALGVMASKIEECNSGLFFRCFVVLIVVGIVFAAMFKKV